jgi:hypothetical protein
MESDHRRGAKQMETEQDNWQGTFDSRRTWWNNWFISSACHSRTFTGEGKATIDGLWDL